MPCAERGGGGRAERGRARGSLDGPRHQRPVLRGLQRGGQTSWRDDSKSQDGRVTGNLPFLKYNIYCLDGLIQNSFSSHFEFGSTIQTEYKEEKVPKPNL